MINNESLKRTHTCIAQIRKDLLPIYEKAAQSSGVALKKIADESQIFTSQQENGTHEDIKTSKNNVAISLFRPDEPLERINDFWNKCESIKAELPITRIS